MLTAVEQLAAEVLANMKPDRAAKIIERGYITIEPACGQVVPVGLSPEVLAAAEQIKRSGIRN